MARPRPRSRTQHGTAGLLLRVCAVLWWLAGAGWAQCALTVDAIDVVLSDGTAVYLEAAEALRQEIGPSRAVQVWQADGLHGRAQQGRVVVALGARALQAALAQDGMAPVVATLVTRKAYESALATQRHAGAVTAVLMDQPPARQINLIRSVLPGRLRLGVLAGREAEPALVGVQAVAREQRLVVRTEPVTSTSDVAAALARLLPDVDLVLAIPDAVVFNPGTVHNVLLSAFRQQRPVIGFSPFYVRSGALAAVYSSPAQLGRQSAEVALRLLAGASAPPPLAPRYFSATVNATVARALGVRVDEEAELTARLQAMEREP